ncbi:hypothetical protein NQZ68_026288 [Dissostichus eleginoides]|nr:hypothetical protein NQZ68_026288 [Dissostichus eleginoides]
MESFSLIPNVNFECSKKYMKRERRELALEILEASGLQDLDLPSQTGFSVMTVNDGTMPSV